MNVDYNLRELVIFHVLQSTADIRVFIFDAKMIINVNIFSMGIC